MSSRLSIEQRFLASRDQIDQLVSGGQWAEAMTAIEAFMMPGKLLRFRRGLSPASRAWLLGMKSFVLQAFGQLDDAASCKEVAVRASARLGDFLAATRSCAQLCEVLLYAGRIQHAIEVGLLAIEFADKASDSIKGYALSKLANAEFQAGQYDVAEHYFREALRLNPELRFGFGGYLFAELLQELGKTEEVAALAETLKQGQWQHLRGAAHLLTGEYNTALGLMLASGVKDELPRAYLARARCSRLANQYQQALVDLDAIGMLEPRPGQLFIWDWAIEHAALCLAQRDPAGAATWLGALQPDKDFLAYRRRHVQFHELQAALAHISR